MTRKHRQENQKSAGIHQTWVRLKTGILGFYCPGPGSISGGGTEILQSHVGSGQTKIFFLRYNQWSEKASFRMTSNICQFYSWLGVNIQTMLRTPTTQFSSVYSLSHVQLFATPWTTACHASLTITNFWSLLKLMSIKSVMPSNHLILCRLFLLLPSIFPSTRVFSNESFLHNRWPKYWSFSFSISPSHEYSGLISFRMDWLDLLSVQGTLKSLLQHHSSKASIRHSAFFIVELSHL